MTHPSEDVWRNVQTILIPIQRVLASALHQRLTATTRRFVAHRAALLRVPACLRRPPGLAVTAGSLNVPQETPVSSRRGRGGAGLMLPPVPGPTSASLSPPATAPALAPCVAQVRSAMTGRMPALSRTPCVPLTLGSQRLSVFASTPVSVLMANCAVQRGCAGHQCLVKMCSLRH